jgi:hypothetical protein
LAKNGTPVLIWETQPLLDDYKYQQAKTPVKLHLFSFIALTPKGPRVFQWKNGQNYPLLKNTPIIIFQPLSTAFDCKILKLTSAANTS